MGKQSQWNHGSDKTGRFRGGKTASDKASGAHRATEQSKSKPIRQTSSHRIGSQDNRGPEFWGG